VSVCGGWWLERSMPPAEAGSGGEGSGIVQISPHRRVIDPHGPTPG
jgi:hypothetical protein